MPYILNSFQPTVFKTIIYSYILAIHQALALPNNMTSMRFAEPCVRSVSLDGSGNPHQNYYEIQVSDTNCGAGGIDCAVQQASRHKVSYTIEGDDGYRWISGGFDVKRSYETDVSFGCASHHEPVCIWVSVARTAYTVHEASLGSCRSDGHSFIIKSPNNNNIGGGPYCVYGNACRSNGEGYWNNNGPAGGPQ